MTRKEEREPFTIENEGDKIFGMFHRPLVEDKVPAVLICHGLAGHKIGKERLYVTIAEHLLQFGIGTLRFDFRGNGESEGEFADMTIQGEVSDTLKAIEFLEQHPHVDPNKLAILGRSFGGAVAVLAAAQAQKFKAIALMAPVFDSIQWEEHWEKAQAGEMSTEERHDLMRINGQLPSMAFYQQLFAMDLEKEVQRLQHIPMFLVHGEMDPMINISHSEKYHTIRQNSTAQTDFIRLPHSDHDFTHPEEKEKAIQETCHWLAKTLLD